MKKNADGIAVDRDFGEEGISFSYCAVLSVLVCGAQGSSGDK